MKKSLLIILLFLFSVTALHANHIKGGFFSYEYLGPGSGPNMNKYRVTLTIYMLCTPTPEQLNNPINFSIFNTGDGTFVRNVSVSITNQYTLGKASDDQCITGNQQGCYYYIVEYRLAELELPSTPTGFTIAYQRCCRIAGIQNLMPPSASIGNTFEIKIPGTNLGAGAPLNTSPRFRINDTIVVCGGSYFEYPFIATDPDLGDSLAYEFCDALQGGSTGASAPPTAANPPYSPVPYIAPFSGSQPLGASVTINPVTGLISGIAPAFPATGEYVISVCVKEYKSGVYIGSVRKELHVRIGDCEPVRAELDPTYVSCDGFTMNFSNNANSSIITSWFWDFGVPSATNDTSIAQNPTFTYPDTGTYVLRLIVNKGQQCTATDSAIVKVYPGFFPGFTSTGVCYLNPIQFNDTSRTAYGVVDSWFWNFGDLSTLADTSRLQNPQWLYSGPGTKDVTLTVTNSKGCKKTVTQTITLLDKPFLDVAFRDTLICSVDALQLQAFGTGNFSWTPNVAITNANTASPTVNPVTTTTYYVQLEDRGCRNTDSVKVRVLNVVSVRAMNDTTICATDAVQLSAVTDGLQYLWSPSATINNPTLLNPVATPTVDTRYTIRATVGSCSSVDDVLVRVVPYPVANAGPDTTICYNTSTQLNGSHDGSSFSWSPANYLNNPSILNPLAMPPRTTQFVLSAFDTRGCPKPGRDTVLVTVLPKILPFAGRDTAVVVGQPLQFHASGGTRYEWTPPTGLSATNIFNPVGLYDASIESIRYTVKIFNEAGCFDTASVNVKIYKTNPTVFVPTAFTPNNDGLNDRLAPIAVGIEKINYFRIYNRWGELVFSTTVNGHGWDGKIGGVNQASNTYVWMVSAVDFLGNAFFQKGTVTLIR